jgi:large subunit ribosomal protein L18
MKKQQIMKGERKQRRANRVRARIRGSKEMPRLSVHRSLQHISAQLIDDTNAMTLGYADDREVKGNKTERAAEVGKRIAGVAKEKGIAKVVFDRGSFRYHGRVKALAEAARAAGLEF